MTCTYPLIETIQGDYKQSGKAPPTIQYYLFVGYGLDGGGENVGHIY